MENKLCQRGDNPKYPKEVLYWKFGLPVPEWLSDTAKVKFIDGDGNITLDFRETTTGLELHDSSGKYVLLRLTSRDDFICKSFTGDYIFSLTSRQANILFCAP